ncbi:MAG: hypothetical protein HY848_13675 [Betaproteobacteria bacterium]|nr:hypothetical protein [Betaproteobacteria bacterium]
MPKKSGEHTLEFLLDFNGHVHRYAGGYWLKFEITKVEANDGKPHGLGYSFTLHGPDNRRLIGFDNAHGVPAKGARFKKRPKEMDHWHRTDTDEGRPYAFKDAETLLDDFFDEVERVLSECGIPFEVVGVTQGDSR